MKRKIAMFLATAMLITTPADAALASENDVIIEENDIEEYSLSEQYSDTELFIDSIDELESEYESEAATEVTSNIESDETEFITDELFYNSESMDEDIIAETETASDDVSVEDSVCANDETSGENAPAAVSEGEGDEESYEYQDIEVIDITEVSNISNEETETDADIWDGSIASAYAGGTGTQESPFLISTAAQLAKLANDSDNAYYYTLTNDIYLNDPDYDYVNEWSSISPFTGNFDGQGYCIYGIYGGSLFGYSTGTIRNVVIGNSSITSGYIIGSSLYAGVIAGRAAHISKCAVKGTVTINVSSTRSMVYVGGIVGYATTVDQCFNEGTVGASGSYKVGVGGISGQVSGEVTNCYNIGSVSGSSSRGGGYTYCGGIVGCAYDCAASISCCYNVASMRSYYYIGGIIGLTTNKYLTTLTYCYTTTRLVGSSANSKSYGSYIEEECLRLTEDEMKSSDSYSGFDFDSIWTISGDNNNGYPMLKWNCKGEQEEYNDDNEALISVFGGEITAITESSLVVDGEEYSTAVNFLESQNEDYYLGFARLVLGNGGITEITMLEMYEGTLQSCNLNNDGSGTVTIDSVEYTTKGLLNISLVKGYINKTVSYGMVDGIIYLIWNELIYVKSMTPESGYEYADYSSLVCTIKFTKYLSVDKSGDAYAYLMPDSADEFDLTAAVCKVPVCYVSSSNSSYTKDSLYLDFGTVTTGEKYYILIDSDEVAFEDGTFFSGIQNKDSWNFKTVSIEFSSLTNSECAGKISSEIYNTLFRPIVAAYWQIRDSGEDGICYGFSSTIAAWNENYSTIHSDNEDSLLNIEKTTKITSKYTFLEYIQLSHIYQYTSAKSNERKENKNQYAELYQAIRDYQNGTGSALIICIHDPGHAILPIGILSEDDSSVEILIYDCNKNYDADLDTNSFLSTLTLKKSGGEIVGWEYSGFEENYITFNYVDNACDNLIGSLSETIYQEQSNLLYTDTVIDQIAYADEYVYVDSCTDNDTDTSYEDLYFYWTDNDSVSRSATESSMVSLIGLTDGYQELSAETALDSDVTLNLNTSTVKVEFNGDSGDNAYSLIYREMDDERNESMITIEGIAQDYIELIKTEDGVLLDSDDLTNVTVTNSINGETKQLTITSGIENVLINTDSGNVALYEDADNDGVYESDVTNKLTSNQADMSTCMLDLSASVYTYDGTAKIPSVTVTDGSLTLVEGTDYTIAFADNVYAGIATVTVEGIGNYTGTITGYFIINKAEQSLTAYVSPSTITVGSSAQIALSSAIGTVNYISSSDSVVTVDSNGIVSGVSAGTATIIVSALGDDNHSAASTKVTITVTAMVESDASSDAGTTTEGGTTAESKTETEGSTIDGDGTTTSTSGTSSDASSSSVAAVGASLSDGTASYTITAAGTAGMSVTYTAPKSKTVTSITIPATVTVNGNIYSVTAIADSAFAGCTSLKTVTIGTNVTSIEASAFSGCTSLTSVSVGAKVTTIGANAFYKCTALKTLSGCAAVTSIGSSAFQGCTALTKVDGMTKLTTIGSKAFYNCKKLTTIGSKASTVTLASVQTIGKSAFQGCKALKKVNLTSKALTSIGESAFQGCTALKSFTAKSTVLKTIGKKAFYGDKKLATITLKTKKLSKSSVKTNAFKGVKSTCTFKVPSAKVSAYKKIFKARGAGSKIKVKKL